MRLGIGFWKKMSLPVAMMGTLSGCLEESRPTIDNPSEEGGRSEWIQEKVPQPSVPGSAVNVLPEQRLVRENGASSREFTVDVAEAGEYYLGAWIDGIPGREYSVLVDGQAVPGVRFTFAEGGWGSSLASYGKDPARMRLEKGRHTVSIRSAGDLVPNVEKLQLARTPAAAEFPETAYREHIRRLVAESRPQAKIAQAKRAEDPLIAYSYALEQPVTYTYYTSVYMASGGVYTFSTNSLSSGADPVLHIYSPSNPSASWFNDDYNPPDRNSRITITAPPTGWYTVVLRAYGTSTGTATLVNSGTALCTNCALGGTLVWVGSSTPSGTLNYFTGYSTSGVDTRLWLLDGNSMRAENDDYAGSGNFSWGANSRLRGSFGNISYALVSAYSSSNPSGTTDLYAKLPDAADAPNYFPNLYTDDAIQTAPFSSTYNCISWSGGVTSTWHWPIVSGNPWYVSGNPLQSFHNFYSNTCAGGGTCKRYNEANIWKYENYSTSSSGRIVALWKHNTEGYTHASVMKPGNGVPHGYDWESKPGMLERTLHPRDALADASSGGYGQIEGYYQHTGYTAKVSAAGKAPEEITEEQSINRGNSVLEAPVAFSAEEKARLAALKAGQAPGTQATFERLLGAWKATFPAYSHHSDPARYRANPEYAAFAEFCAAQGRAVWPQLFEVLETRQPITGFAVMDLLKEHEALLDEAVREWTRNQVQDGKFVIFSPENARMRMAKKLIAKELAGSD